MPEGKDGIQSVTKKKLSPAIKEEIGKDLILKPN